MGMLAAAGIAAAGGLASAYIGSQGHTSSSNSIPYWPTGQISNQVTNTISKAQDLFERGPYADPSKWYVGPNANQTGAANLQAQYGANMAFPNAAMQNATATLQGQYLDPNSNPWLQNTFNMGANAVQNRVGSDFNRAGRFGSGMQSDTYQKNLNDLATNIYGGNYQNERNRQIQTLGLAPQIAGLPFINTQAMMNAGAMQQSWAQQAQNAPLDRLKAYRDFAIQGSPGTATQTQTPYYTNPLNSALGFGMGAYSMMNKGGGTNWWGGQDYGGGTSSYAPGANGYSPTTGLSTEW